MISEITIPRQKSKSTTIMILGGNQIYRTDIEILDISQKLSVCTKPVNFPEEHARGAIGTFYRGNNIICGGELAGKLCHQYNFLDHEWIMAPFTLTTERSGAGEVMLSNESWVVLGGNDINGNPISTIEVMTDELFLNSLLWPEAVSGHCMKQVNNSHIFVAGGQGNFGLLGTAYFLNVLGSQFYQVEKPMMHPRQGHVCGFATTKSGEHFIVIAGGFENIDVELMALVSLKWKTGPKLPHELNWAASSMSGDSMMIVGGEHIGYCSKPHLCLSSNSIFKLNIDKHKWERQSQTLHLPRSKHVIIEVPDAIKICQKSCKNCSGN